MKLDYAVRIAQETDTMHADTICYYIDQASANPDNGICRRSKSLIENKIRNGQAVIAVSADDQWMGFCYIQDWNDGFVSSCGLIVHPACRNEQVATRLKEKVLQLAKQKYPGLKYFGLTTSLAVMKINSELNYEPVTYREITRDERFWDSCRTCMHYDILTLKKKSNCLCTAMVHQDKS